MLTFYTDGACKNNGNFGKQRAWICVADQDGKIIIHDFVGDKTNIEAEGLALIAAFKHISKNALDATIITDSKFWHDAAHKHWRLKVTRLWPIRDELYKLFEVGKTKLIWKPREYNLAGHFLDTNHEKKWLQEHNVKQPEVASSSRTKYENVADAIRTLRKERKLTQKKLGELTNMKQSHISRLEHRDYSGCTITSLQRIGKALGLTLTVNFVDEGR